MMLKKFTEQQYRDCMGNFTGTYTTATPESVTSLDSEVIRSAMEMIEKIEFNKLMMHSETFARLKSYGLRDDSIIIVNDLVPNDKVIKWLNDKVVGWWTVEGETQ